MKDAQLMESQSKETDILTVEEVAAILRVPPSWVRAHANRARRPYLPAFRLGRYTRFQRGSILATIQKWHQNYPEA
jgi:predicted transcriptional regulator of viral defense system